jgi:replication factor A1
MLKENKVYIFSNGSIKIANKKFTSIKNDYCITFDKNSQIVSVEDDEDIKAQGFCFVIISEVNDFEQTRAVDVIGVITNAGSVTNFTPKNGGSSKDKRTLVVVDDSNFMVGVTLWGPQANTPNLKEGNVIAIRGAKVSDYQGKTLNSADENS